MKVVKTFPIGGTGYLPWRVWHCAFRPVAAQNFSDEQNTTTLVNQAQKSTLQLEQRSQVTYDFYILGPGI